MTLPSLSLSDVTVSRKRLAFLCTVIVTVSLVVWLLWAGRQGLFALSDTRMQPYTELYFSQSTDLPTKLVAGQQYAIPFMIANHQGASRTVRYQATIAQGGRSDAQPIQTLNLADGQRVTSTLRFTPTNPVTETTVTVQLLGTKQVISFRVGP